MKIKPILFSTPMVQAILDGRKTQTRRICRHQSWSHSELVDFRINEAHYREVLPDVSAKYQIDDILWVRETFEVVPVEMASIKENRSDVRSKIKYKADGGQSFLRWKPSIFMPKEACRIFLKVTNVRIERLQDISEEYAVLEGVELGDIRKGIMYKNYLKNQHYYLMAKQSFQSLWKSINGRDSWDQNPWVWVYEFEKTEKPKNFLTS